jgi:AraC-like DNA-binding protein
MKPIFTSIEELYARKEPTGEMILDEVISYLRRTRIITALDLALLMDVNKRQLYGAISILVGLTLGEFITRWRLLQARELLHAEPYSSTPVRADRLNAVAHRCGWRSGRVLLAVARRYSFDPEAAPSPESLPTL